MKINTFSEDTCGFVNFPYTNDVIIGKSIGKTLIYLIAFEPVRNPDKGLSNVNLNLQGSFVSDDIVHRQTKEANSLDDLLDLQIDNDSFDMYYFPNINSEDDLLRLKSIDIISSICIGWSNLTYEFRNGKMWVAGYRDLTVEGQRLYYSIKKLHNNKEVRILTFNQI